jgi:hypothetical protein
MSNAPFVERIFESGADTIAVRFLLPTLAPGGEYQCRWEIHWPDHVQRRHTPGLDGLQALMLALRTVHAELMDSDLYASERLTFEGKNDLGLPSSWW